MRQVSPAAQRDHELGGNFTDLKHRDITTEGLLILFCCRGVIDEHTVGCVRSLIDSGLDWDRVLKVAHRERVLPVLSERLNTTFQDRVPANVLAELKRRILEVTSFALVLGAELAAAVKLIEARGLRVLTFKGPTLAVAAFESPTSRMFGDVDLVVDPNDFAACQKHLTANNYAIVEDYGFEKSFRRKGSWATVDLHRTITPPSFPCRLLFNDLWARREMVTVFGNELPSLSITDHLLVHCLQITHDRYQNRLSLAKLTDIAGLLRRCSDIDWDHLLAMADRLAMSRRLLVALGAAAGLLASPLPPQVTLLLNDTGSLCQLSQFTSRGVLEQSNRGIKGFIERVVFHVRIHERKRDKLAQLRMVSQKIQQAWAKAKI